MSKFLELLQPKNAYEIRAYTSNPTHGLLITAPGGFGVNDLADEVARIVDKAFLTLEPSTTSSKNIESISVDDIRNIYSITSTKNSKPRVFLIKSANKMTVPAQNALLKLLEEPGRNTYFILSCEDTSSLIPTVMSRLQKISVDRLSTKSVDKLMSKYELNNETYAQIKFLGDGLPAELVKLSTDNQYFNTRSQNIRDSKDIILSSKYQKLYVIHKCKDDRVAAIRLIDDCLLILKSTTLKHVSIDSVSLINRLLTSRDAISSNGNIRLGLMIVVV